MTNEIFMDRVEDVLKQKKLTQKELAEDLGLRRPTLSDWKKNGAVPAGDICLRIAYYLGVSVEWLISGKEKEELAPELRTLCLVYNQLSATHREELIEIASRWADKDSVAEKTPKMA